MRRCTKWMFFADWGLHFFFITRENKLYTAGKNTTGQLGLGDSENRHEPTRVLHKFRSRQECFNVRKISTGLMNSYFLLNSGSVFSCGDNLSGACSAGSFGDFITIPTLLKSERDGESRDTGLKFIDVVSGFSSVYLLTSQGRVLSAGRNSNGELGVGDKIKRNVATLVQFPRTTAKVEQISASRWKSAFLTRAKNVWMCGANRCGELCLGHHIDICTPAKISFDHLRRKIRVDAVYLASATSYFLSASGGAVYVGGMNCDGEFGNSNLSNSNVPLLSKSICNVSNFAVGNGYCMFQKYGSRSVWVLGNAKFGKLGVEKVRFIKTASEVQSLRAKNISQITLSSITSYFLDHTGKRCYACGHNKYGQIPYRKCRKMICEEIVSFGFIGEGGTEGNGEVMLKRIGKFGNRINGWGKEERFCYVVENFFIFSLVLTKSSNQ